MAASAHPPFKFREFELDVRAYELRRNQQPVRLERRPMDLLLLLLERRGELVTRTDIAKRLWGDKVFIDIDLGVNTAIRKVRQALGDDPEKPLFIETVSGRGYRFIAPVQAAAPPSPLADRITLAVLPFENLGGDTEQEYIADGLTEEVIAAVGRIDPERLAVIGRTSINRYKRTHKNLSEIGSELRTQHVVEGSIRVERERMRVTVRLIDAGQQSQVWSASYDSEPGSLLQFQRELSGAIAEQVRRRLVPELSAKVLPQPTDNAEAYDLYLRGRYLWNQLTPATTRRAVEFYRRATALDPRYALAWAGMADAYSSSPISGDTRPLEMWPLAKEAVERAIRSDAELTETHIAVGFLNLFLDWNWEKAEASFRRAVQLDGNNPLCHRMLGITLSHMKRHDEALASLRRARELDPFYAMYHALSTLAAYHAGHYEEALEFGRQAVIVDPEFWIGHFQIAQVHEHLGDHDLAMEDLANAARFSGGNSKTFSLRGYILAKTGRIAEAKEVISTLARFSADRYVPPYATALIHLGLGELDVALQWLEQAYAVRDVHLLFLPVDPKWNRLRSDARFIALLERCAFVGRVER